MVQNRCFCVDITDVIGLLHDGESGCFHFTKILKTDEGSVMKFCRLLHITWEHLDDKFESNQVI